METWFVYMLTANWLLMLFLILNVFDGTSVVTSFLDSAPYGSKVGSKEYKIKVDREVYYRIEVNGSDGGITR